MNIHKFVSRLLTLASVVCMVLFACVPLYRMVIYMSGGSLIVMGYEFISIGPILTSYSEPGMWLLTWLAVPGFVLSLFFCIVANYRRATIAAGIGFACCVQMLIYHGRYAREYPGQYLLTAALLLILFASLLDWSSQRWGLYSRMKQGIDKNGTKLSHKS